MCSLFDCCINIMKIASEISRHVRDRSDGVKRLKDAIIQSFKTSTTTDMPGCCPPDGLGLQRDLRFPYNVSHSLYLLTTVA